MKSESRHVAMPSEIIATAPPGYGSTNNALSNLSGQVNSAGSIAISAKPIVGTKPAEVMCPECGARGFTTIEYRSTTRTHFLAIVLCWTACLCCLPYYMHTCRNADHSCPTCGAYIGTYKS